MISNHLPISYIKRINVQCVEGQTVPLKCCVQSPFKVKWSRGSLALGKFKMFQKTSQSDHTENTHPITVYFINNTVKCSQMLSFSPIFCVILIDYYLSPKLLHVKTVCMGMDDKTNYLVQNVLQVKWGIRCEV
ncbi:hypothetical protein F7725_003959 [Dissostichus mawsoni]|uniref:Uncharacterized protein n=1 Tax=Dissostichus mawsoni TaxID=36200 RepID=A0A7J5YD01_DISMA|nr:hypothetical protein F7725_003959 [Dissostichus mawsoni]